MVNVKHFSLIEQRTRSLSGGEPSRQMIDAKRACFNMNNYNNNNYNNNTISNINSSNSSHNSQSVNECSTVYLGDLDMETTERQLRDFFESHQIQIQKICKQAHSMAHLWPN